jgi:hypothetical protein
MAKAYSQDLRDRVIDAVTGAGMKWVERYRETGSRKPVGTGGHRPSVLKPHRDFLVAARAEQPDITLEAFDRRRGTHPKAPARLPALHLPLAFTWTTMRAGGWFRPPHRPGRDFSSPHGRRSACPARSAWCLAVGDHDEVSLSILRRPHNSPTDKPDPATGRKNLVWFAEGRG